MHICILFLFPLYLHINNAKQLSDNKRVDVSPYDYVKHASIASNLSYAPSPCGRRHDGKYWCMPDLYLIGVSKAGTSSMAMHLNNHHCITGAKNGRKYEGHFFDTKPEVKLSDAQTGLRSLYNRPMIMDFTPNYLSVDSVPRLIRSLYDPDIANKLKFIVALREPVSRTISSWLYKKNSHPNLPDFASSVRGGMKEGKCIEKCYSMGQGNKDIEKFEKCEIAHCVDRIMSSHVVKSMYFYQLLVWFRYFSPDQFFIYTIERFISEPLQVYRDIITFLDIPMYNRRKNVITCGSAAKRNVRGFKNETDLLCAINERVNSNRAKADLIEQTKDEALIRKLQKFYEPHNILLDKLLVAVGKNVSGYSPN